MSVICYLQIHCYFNHVAKRSRSFNLKSKNTFAILRVLRRAEHFPIQEERKKQRKKVINSATVDCISFNYRRVLRFQFEMFKLLPHFVSFNCECSFITHRLLRCCYSSWRLLRLNSDLHSHTFFFSLHTFFFCFF